MADNGKIESDIDSARHDLEASLAALKDLVREKVDVKAHVKDAIHRAEDELGKQYRHARVRLREDPWLYSFAGVALVVGIAAGMIYGRLTA
jgi:hypothetical protein